MKLSASKSPSSNLIAWAVGGFFALNAIGSVLIAVIYALSEFGVIESADQPIVIVGLIPILLVWIVAVIWARMRTLRPENGVEITIGNEIEIRRKKNGKVLFLAPRSQTQFKRYILRAGSSTPSLNYKSGVALAFVAHGKKQIVGVFDPNIEWMENAPTRFGFDWVTDSETYYALLKALEIPFTGAPGSTASN